MTSVKAQLELVRKRFDTVQDAHSALYAVQSGGCATDECGALREAEDECDVALSKYNKEYRILEHMLTRNG